MSYFGCREDDKAAILIHLLKNVIDQSEQTVIFAATKHHIEYLNMVCFIDQTSGHTVNIGIFDWVLFSLL